MKVVWFWYPSLQKIDIEGVINGLEVDLSGVKILTDESENQLKDFKDSVQLDYQGFLDEVKG